MSKTMADHARAYRQRKAAKIARYEAALREIQSFQVSHTCGWNEVREIARQALGDAA